MIKLDDNIYQNFKVSPIPEADKKPTNYPKETKFNPKETLSNNQQ